MQGPVARVAFFTPAMEAKSYANNAVASVTVVRVNS
jgi:hypothetical protein